MMTYLFQYLDKFERRSVSWRLPQLSSKVLLEVECISPCDGSESINSETNMPTPMYLNLELAPKISRPQVFYESFSGEPITSMPELATQGGKRARPKIAFDVLLLLLFSLLIIHKRWLLPPLLLVALIVRLLLCFYCSPHFPHLLAWFTGSISLSLAFKFNCFCSRLLLYILVGPFHYYTAWIRGCLGAWLRQADEHYWFFARQPIALTLIPAWFVGGDSRQRH